MPIPAISLDTSYATPTCANVKSNKKTYPRLGNEPGANR